MLLKKMNLLELSSRTMFYHLQMMNVQKSKIFVFKPLLRDGVFFRPGFLRKTYKQIFGIESRMSIYLKRSISQVGYGFGRIIGSKQANLPVCCSKFAMMVQTSLGKELENKTYSKHGGVF